MHANHVHHGSCANQGEVHVPLTDLDADAAGAAQMETVWADNDLDHFRAGHYVAIHVSSTADGVGAVIACGDVVAAATVSVPGTGNAGLAGVTPGRGFSTLALTLAAVTALVTFGARALTADRRKR